VIRTSLLAAVIAGLVLGPVTRAQAVSPILGVQAATSVAPTTVVDDGTAVSVTEALPDLRLGQGDESAPADPLSLQELEAKEAELAEYDPWVGFNERTFAFNHGFDRHLLKPVAKAYDKVVPDVVQRAVRNAFQNLGSFRRIINTALQGRFNATGQEFGRFVINTVFGLGGLIDAAPSFGVEPRAEADTGQTFGVWGIGPGPYLVLPLLPPLTVRDAVGFALDAAMDPVFWVAPLPASIGVTAERMVNERSMNLALYENVEETVFDLYSAVRNAYLQRRQRAIDDVVRRERLILTGPEPDGPAR
jgi:phospholipid-binding lipoprotein MlaA